MIYSSYSISFIFIASLIQTSLSSLTLLTLGKNNILRQAGDEKLEKIIYNYYPIKNDGILILQLEPSIGFSEYPKILISNQKAQLLDAIQSKQNDERGLLICSFLYSTTCVINTHSNYVFFLAFVTSLPSQEQITVSIQEESSIIQKSQFKVALNEEYLYLYNIYSPIIQISSSLINQSQSLVAQIEIFLLEANGFLLNKNQTYHSQLRMNMSTRDSYTGQDSKLEILNSSYLLENRLLVEQFKFSHKNITLKIACENKDVAYRSAISIRFQIFSSNQVRQVRVGSPVIHLLSPYLEKSKQNTLQYKQSLMENSYRKTQFVKFKIEEASPEVIEKLSTIVENQDKNGSTSFKSKQEFQIPVTDYFKNDEFNYSFCAELRFYLLKQQLNTIFPLLLRSSLIDTEDIKGQNNQSEEINSFSFSLFTCGCLLITLIGLVICKKFLTRNNYAFKHQMHIEEQQEEVERQNNLHNIIENIEQQIQFQEEKAQKKLMLQRITQFGNSNIEMVQDYERSIQQDLYSYQQSTERKLREPTIGGSTGLTTALHSRTQSNLHYQIDSSIYTNDQVDLLTKNAVPKPKNKKNHLRIQIEDSSFEPQNIQAKKEEILKQDVQYQEQKEEKPQDKLEEKTVKDEADAGIEIKIEKN